MNENAYKVPSETVESGLLYSCTTMDQWFQLIAFKEEDFTSCREIFRFYGEYISQYGSPPTPGQVSAKFQWNPTPGDFRYWFDEMRKYTLARKLMGAVRDGYANINEPDKALSVLLDKLSTIRTEDNQHVSASDASAMRRLGTFDVRTDEIFNNQGMVGLPTGIHLIDQTQIGWLPGSLVGCYARPSIGKTWWLIKQGITSWMAGKTVLAIFPEMGTGIIELRIDCVAGDALGIPVNYNEVLKGDPAVRDNYQMVLGLMSKSKRWWTYDSVETGTIGLSEIQALIRLHQPDLVLIDGISLLKFSGAQATWEKMKELCYGAKNLATQAGVVIIITHQASNTERGRKQIAGAPVGRGDSFIMPSLNEAAFGDSFVAACSDIITLAPDQTTKNVTWYSIRKSRERGWETALPDRMGLVIDFRFGRMVDLGHLGHNPELVGQEARKLLGITI